tara:strand:- start:228 stop:731 length:504 start_codon:yes stop_codon:yes gene_type:complete
MLIFMGCELDLHNHKYENPFDVDAHSENGVLPPALIFSPNLVNAEVGEIVPVNISVLEVSGVGGIHAQVKYDASILSISAVKIASFFASNQEPFLLYKDQGGILDVYISYLGSEMSVSGTGDVATITFQVNTEGNASIRFTENSEFLGPNDIPIKIKGYGKGVIIAK